MSSAESSLSRRLVAILAADAVGYSGMMARDEVGTHRITMSLIEDVFNPAIAARQGEIIKHTGDGMLAVFDSVTQAVECAVEIQSELAMRKSAEDGAGTIDFRIGINLGDVIVEETDIYGDDVNLASRLEGLAPAGGICVSEDVYHQVHRRIDAEFTDAGRHRVKNIPQPVRAYMVSPSGVRLAHSAAQRRRTRKRFTVAAAIVLAGVVAFAGIRFGLDRYLDSREVGQIAVPLPAKPSIAVLPFSYVSSDPAFGYLGDGISEELITGLSRVSGLFVIARNSSFAFKGENRRIPDVARALGVRYVVEGSVIVPRAAAGQAPDRLKINVRLIEGSTGRQLWADAYNDRFDDIVSIQERLSAVVIARISSNLKLAPAQPLATSGEVALLRQKDTANPDAYRAFLKGRETARLRTPQAYDRALDDLTKAVTLDPKFVRAHAALSALYLDIRTLGWYADAVLKDRGLDRGSTGRKSDHHRRIAMAAPSPPPGALRVTARLRARQGRVDVAVKEAERAVALSPSDAESHARLSLTQSWNGEGAKAVASARAAMRLDPKFPPRYRSYLGIAQFVAEDFNAAAASLILAVEGNPANTLARVHLIAALGHLATRAAAAGDANAAARDRRDAAVAIATLNDIRKKTGLQPAVYNISFARNRALYRFDTDLNRFIDGLKAAGVP